MSEGHDGGPEYDDLVDALIRCWEAVDGEGAPQAYVILNGYEVRVSRVPLGYGRVRQPVVHRGPKGSGEATSGRDAADA